ncbi:MAG: TrkH family potassium uptake protein [Spirochaetaceae bacterium]
MNKDSGKTPGTHTAPSHSTGTLLFPRRHRVSSLFEGFALKPAQTILLSFFLVIIAGTLLLMLPFSTADTGGLSFIDALFTSTSAVCVTGLIVVDTATVFSIWGKITVLLLIQIGGLGIMILSYFAVFSTRQRISLEEKMLLSYMLSEENMNSLSKRVRSIIYATFAIEAAGALLLLPSFLEARGEVGESIFFSIFHAVSAFCNAGFALFTDSFEGMSGNAAVNGTLALLIILGGISFAVIIEVTTAFRGRLRKVLRALRLRLPNGKIGIENRGAAKKSAGDLPQKPAGLSLNSKVVLAGTAILLLLGMFLFYGGEHGGVLAELSTAEQYLAAFFQSVTLRTAGFNTVPIGSLAAGTITIMMVFMFVGAAQGSTAGGIKINSAAVILSYVKAVLAGRDDVVLLRYSISSEQIKKAFLVLLFGIISIGVGTTVLSFSEQQNYVDILFEAVSAFGTVGLSRGITSSLTWTGKTVIVILMFLGRLGPLTILAAAAKPPGGVSISYPRGDISI